MIILNALDEIPDEYFGGFVIYFYNNPEGKLVYQFSGTYHVYVPGTYEEKEFVVLGTLKKIKKEVEMLQKDSFFSTKLFFDYGTHKEYGTEGLRISRKLH